MDTGNEVREVEIVELIRINITRGLGVAGDPFRVVDQFWSLDGSFIFELDPHEK